MWRVTGRVKGDLVSWSFFSYYNCVLFNRHFILVCFMVSFYSSSHSHVHVLCYRTAQSYVTSLLWHGGMRDEDERRGYHGMNIMFILTLRSARELTKDMFHSNASIQAYMRPSISASLTNRGGNWNLYYHDKNAKKVSFSFVGVIVGFDNP